MGDDRRAWWWPSRLDPNVVANPDASVGGAGAGYGRVPGFRDPSRQGRPDPRSPAGRLVHWKAELRRIQVEQQISWTLREIDQAANWNDVTRLARALLARNSFDLGVCFGIAESAGEMARSLLGLASTFVLAGLYDAAHLPNWFMRGPLAGIRLEGIAAEWLAGPALFRAHRQREEIVRELRKLAAHPAEFLGDAVERYAAEYSFKWNRFRHGMVAGGLAGNFEAGRVVGGVLVDVLILISAAGDIGKGVKFLAELPELSRLAEGMKEFGRGLARTLEDETGSVRLGGTPDDAPKIGTSGKALKEAAKLEKRLVGEGVVKDGTKYYPEANLTGAGKHGIDWTEGPARAADSGKAQGKFGSLDDVTFAVKKGAELGPGKVGTFDLPPGNKSIVYMPDGTVVPAKSVFVKVYPSGKVHAYPKP